MEHIVFIPTKHGTVTIDAIDRPLWERYGWSFSESRQSWQRHFCHAKYYTLHRSILKAPNDKLVDHISGDVHDHRRCNLRLASYAENARNQKKTKEKTASKYKGVYWRKSRNHWIATIREMQGLHNSLTYLGSSQVEEECARMYDDAARKQYKEFARVNFPNVGEQGALE
jgi:hypothetical protein